MKNFLFGVVNKFFIALFLFTLMFFSYKIGQRSILKKQSAFHSLWNTIEKKLADTGTTEDSWYFRSYIKHNDPATIWRSIEIKIHSADTLTQYLEYPPKIIGADTLKWEKPPRPKIIGRDTVSYKRKIHP